jgi:hypothetical protein
VLRLASIWRIRQIAVLLEISGQSKPWFLVDGSLGSALREYGDSRP